MILDVTAGFRTMWRCKNPPLTVFMDKRAECKPDVIGVWEHLPFRPVFETILFDPSHIVRSGGYDERVRLHRTYGAWGSKREVLIAFHRALKEFARVANRLCFKWCETRDGPTLDQLLPLFRDWRIIHERQWRTKGSGTVKGNAYWVTFSKKEG